jgi:hypothetical protein
VASRARSGPSSSTASCAKLRSRRLTRRLSKACPSYASSDTPLSKHLRGLRETEKSGTKVVNYIRLTDAPRIDWPHAYFFFLPKTGVPAFAFGATCEAANSKRDTSLACNAFESSLEQYQNESANGLP